MSLFIYLKYGGINLASTVELQTLPPDILHEYYRRIGGFLFDGFIERCNSTAVIYSRALDNPALLKVLRRQFAELLKEYDESIHSP